MTIFYSISWNIFEMLRIRIYIKMGRNTGNYSIKSIALINEFSSLQISNLLRTIVDFLISC